MRIAFVSSGQSIHVLKLANGLVSRNHEVTLFTQSNHTKLLHLFDKRINIVILPFKGKIGYYLNFLFLRKKLKQTNFDIINSHYISGYGTLARLSRVKPLVIAVLGSDILIYPNKSKTKKKRVIKNINFAELITSTSESMISAIKNFYKSEKEMIVTPFGVDLKLFKPMGPKIKKTKFTFGIIKKIEKVYGFDILIRAFSKMVLDHSLSESDVELVVYGDGSMVDDYKELTVELKLSEYIKFNGFINNDQVPLAYKEIDFSCFPSLSESFGVAAIESMACGVPVLASDASGFLETIIDGKTGYIVKKGNVDLLAEKMYEILTMDKKILSIMSDNSRKHIVDNYNFDDTISLYISALESILR